MITLLTYEKLVALQPDLLENNFSVEFITSSINTAGMKLDGYTVGLYQDCIDYNYIESPTGPVINEGRSVANKLYRTDAECRFILNATICLAKIVIATNNNSAENRSESYNGYGQSYSSSTQDTATINEDVKNLLINARLIKGFSTSETSNNCETEYSQLPPFGIGNRPITRQEANNAYVGQIQSNDKIGKVLTVGTNSQVEWIYTDLPTNIYAKEEVDAKIDTVNESITTLDGQVVHNTGNENIAGSKTFTSSISCNNMSINNVADPTADQDASTKKYVDTAIANVPTPQVIVGTFTPDPRIAESVNSSLVLQQGNIVYINLSITFTTQPTTTLLGTISGVSLPTNSPSTVIINSNSISAFSYFVSTQVSNDTISMNTILLTGSISISFTYIVA